MTGNGPRWRVTTGDLKVCVRAGDAGEAAAVALNAGIGDAATLGGFIEALPHDGPGRGRMAGLWQLTETVIRLAAARPDAHPACLRIVRDLPGPAPGRKARRETGRRRGRPPRGEGQRLKALEIGLKVRDLRVAAGLSQKALAERAGMQQPALCNLELGRRYPTDRTLGRIVLALGAPAGDRDPPADGPQNQFAQALDELAAQTRGPGTGCEAGGTG